MQAFTLLNEKGGVGKSTLALTLASGLAIQGARVLVVDTDPQGHATVGLSQPKFDGLLRLLAQDAEWDEVTRVVERKIWSDEDEGCNGVLGMFGEMDKGVMYLLPSHLNNRALPDLLDGNFFIMRERLEDWGDDLDFVIFDTSPTPSVIHGLAYLASDYIIFPTQCEFFSMDGLASSTQNMVKGNSRRQQMGLEPIKLLGVQPNMYEAGTKNHSDNLELMKQSFGEGAIWQPIHKRTVWRDAAQVGKTIFAYGQSDVAEAEAWGFVNNVMSKVIENGKA